MMASYAGIGLTVVAATGKSLISGVSLMVSPCVSGCLWKN